MLTNERIKRILLAKGIVYLYHANTVATACTFLENKGLMSRGAVEEFGLLQTSQASDQKDREVDVFYDIFFDSVDVHRRSKNVNHYGPVTFVYSIDLLDVLPQGSVRITKDNPVRWTTEMTEEEKYFLSERELEFEYQKGNFSQHLTIRHQKETLSFDYLEKIIVEDPGENGVQCFRKAYTHLQRLADGLTIEIRQCGHDCHCKERYSSRNPGYIYHRFKIR